METVAQIRNRLRAERLATAARRSAAPSAPAPDAPCGSTDRRTDPSFVVEGDGGRIVVATPVREAAVGSNPHNLMLTGRLVEAEMANRNGAFWTKADLEFGLPTVGHGPLNLLHEVDKVIGTLVNPRMVDATEAAADGTPALGPHIQTDAVVWRWIYPEVASAIERFTEAGTAWFSMECIAERVQCVGPNGCGAEMAYASAARRDEGACVHVRERASHRRLVSPTFQGAAVILPPSQPGWANADLRQRKAAEELVESASIEAAGLKAEDALEIVSSVMAWANR